MKFVERMCCSAAIALCRFSSPPITSRSCLIGWVTEVCHELSLTRANACRTTSHKCADLNVRLRAKWLRDFLSRLAHPAKQVVWAAVLSQCVLQQCLATLSYVSREHSRMFIQINNWQILLPLQWDIDEILEAFQGNIASVTQIEFVVFIVVRNTNLPHQPVCGTSACTFVTAAPSGILFPPLIERI